MPEVPSPENLMDWTEIVEKAANMDLPPAMKAMITFRREEIPSAFYRVFSVSDFVLFFKQKLQFRPVDVDFILKHDAVDTKPHHDQFKTYVWIKTNENIGTFHYYNRLILFQGMIPAYTLLLQPIFQTLQ